MPQSSEPVCSFCDLMRGSAEVSMCYEDVDVVAFMDVQPVNAGHVLVVPRKHFEGLDDIPHDLADRKSTRLNSSHLRLSRMPSSA